MSETLFPIVNSMVGGYNFTICIWLKEVMTDQRHSL